MAMRQRNLKEGAEGDVQILATNRAGAIRAQHKLYILQLAEIRKIRYRIWRGARREVMPMLCRHAVL